MAVIITVQTSEEEKKFDVLWAGYKAGEVDIQVIYDFLRITPEMIADVETQA